MLAAKLQAIHYGMQEAENKGLHLLVETDNSQAVNMLDGEARHCQNHPLLNLLFQCREARAKI